MQAVIDEVVQRQMGLGQSHTMFVKIGSKSMQLSSALRRKRRSEHIGHMIVIVTEPGMLAGSHEGMKALKIVMIIKTYHAATSVEIWARSCAVEACREYILRSRDR